MWYNIVFQEQKDLEVRLLPTFLFQMDLSHVKEQVGMTKPFGKLYFLCCYLKQNGA